MYPQAPVSHPSLSLSIFTSFHAFPHLQSSSLSGAATVVKPGPLEGPQSQCLLLEPLEELDSALTLPSCLLGS